MKRFFSLLCIVFLLSGCLTGCQRNRTPSLCRIATRVEVSCRHKDLQFQRNYTKNEKMQAVLTYIRLLKPRGNPDPSEEYIDAEHFQITVFLSDGTTHIYQQAGHRYFKSHNQPWKAISPEIATGLYVILAQYKSDTPAQI